MTRFQVIRRSSSGLRPRQQSSTSSPASSCLSCPSISPCGTCPGSQICQQIFRPSGDCSTCPVNVCLPRPSDDKSNGSGASASLVAGPIGGCVGVLVVAAVIMFFWIKKSRRTRAVTARRREECKLRDAKATTFRLGGLQDGSSHAGRQLDSQSPLEERKQPSARHVEVFELVSHSEDNQSASYGDSQMLDPFAESLDELGPVSSPRFSTACASHLSRITEDEEDSNADSGNSSSSSSRSRPSTGGSRSAPLPPNPAHRCVGAPLNAITGASMGRGPPTRRGILLNRGETRPGILDRQPSRPLRASDLDLKLSENANGNKAVVQDLLNVPGTSRRQSTDTIKTTNTAYSTRTTGTTASEYVRAGPKIMMAISATTCGATPATLAVVPPQLACTAPFPLLIDPFADPQSEEGMEFIDPRFSPAAQHANDDGMGSFDPRYQQQLLHRASVCTTTTSHTTGTGVSIPILHAGAAASTSRLNLTHTPLDRPIDVEGEGNDDSASVRTRWGDYGKGATDAASQRVASTSVSIAGLSVLDDFSWSVDATLSSSSQCSSSSSANQPSERLGAGQKKA